jgi:hypothetical protein
MPYHPPSYYPHKMKYNEPTECYLCGNPVTDRGDNDINKAGKGIYCISCRAYHVIHYKCEKYYYKAHTWKGYKSLDEIHTIAQQNYIDMHIHFDWVI